MDKIDSDFGKIYATAWSPQNVEAYSKYFAPNGSLKVNESPAVFGRKAITEVAQSFMTSFLDMAVALDSFPIKQKSSRILLDTKSKKS